MAIMDIIKRLEAEIAQNGPPEPARADDFREIATSGIRFEAQYNGIYAVVNVA